MDAEDDSVRWFQVGVFHLVPRALLGALYEQLDVGESSAPSILPTDRAAFDLPGPCLLEREHAALQLPGLSLKVPVTDLERLETRIARAKPLPDIDAPAFAISGAIRVLYLTAEDRQTLLSQLQSVQTRGESADRELSRFNRGAAQLNDSGRGALQLRRTPKR